MPITLDMSTAQPLAPPPVTLDMSTAKLLDELHPNSPVRPALSSTVLNPRIRNIQTPYDPSVSAGQNFYAGAKAGMYGSLPSLLYVTPAGLAEATIGGTVGSAAGKQVAKSAGGGEFAQEVGGDVGGLAGAGIATAGTNWALLKAKTFYNALPEDVQKALIGLASPRLQHALHLADALGIGKEPVPLDATAENQPYAGETARGRKLAAPLQAAPAAAASPETSAQPAAAATQFAARPRVVPSVQNIRENIAQARDAEAAPNRPTADTLEDRALQQEMNWDLERHGWAADSAARREFIARNSTGVTKAELTGAAAKPVNYTKTPGVASSGTAAGMTAGEVDDLMSKMQQMLDAAKKGKSSGND